MTQKRIVMCFAVFIAIVSSPENLVAQSAPGVDNVRIDAEQNLKEFDFIVAKITANYAGYETKTSGDAMLRLTALTAELRARAARAPSQTDLLEIIKQYLAFFKDEHTSVSAISANSASPSVTGSFAPRADITEAGARRQFASLVNRRAPIEGIWSIDNTRYRMAVVRTTPNADAFSAVVLTSTNADWKPGMIKASITRTPTGSYAMTYRTGDFSEVPIKASLVAGGAVLDVGNYGGWRNEWPSPIVNGQLDKSFPSSKFFLRRLSPKTLWIRIPNFHHDNAAIVAKLIKDNEAALGATDNLIIDTRRNGGGSDFAYVPLLPYVYSRPIYSIGIEMKASEDNIILRQAAADELAKIPEAKDTVAQLKREIVGMKANLGRYFQPYAQPFLIDKIEPILPFPKRVAILIDRAGSTGEQFLLDARQSRKVTLFGQENSAGVLDFANVVSMKSPSGRFEVQWATSRSLRLPNDPVDNGGIAPDIRIPASITDPVTYAQRWLERQVD